MPAGMIHLGIGSYGLLLDIKRGLLYPLNYITVRCLVAELPQGTQSSHEVDRQVPSKHGDLHSRECSWCRRFQTLDPQQHESPDLRNHKP